MLELAPTAEGDWLLSRPSKSRARQALVGAAVRLSMSIHPRIDCGDARRRFCSELLLGARFQRSRYSLGPMLISYSWVKLPLMFLSNIKKTSAAYLALIASPASPEKSSTWLLVRSFRVHSSFTCLLSPQGVAPALFSGNCPGTRVAREATEYLHGYPSDLRLPKLQSTLLPYIPNPKISDDQSLGRSHS